MKDVDLQVVLRVVVRAVVNLPTAESCWGIAERAMRESAGGPQGGVKDSGESFSEPAHC